MNTFSDILIKCRNQITFSYRYLSLVMDEVLDMLQWDTSAGPAKDDLMGCWRERWSNTKPYKFSSLYGEQLLQVLQCMRMANKLSMATDACDIGQGDQCFMFNRMRGYILTQQIDCHQSQLTGWSTPL